MLILRDIGKRVPCYLQKCQMFCEPAALAIELFKSKCFFSLKAMLVTVQSDHYVSILIHALIRTSAKF